MPTVAVTNDQIIELFFDMLDGGESLTPATSPPVRNHMSGTEKWQFTLPALYDVACQEYPDFSTLDYSKFRQLVIESPVNEYLEDAGWQIVLQKDNLETDQNIYCLTRL
ncbi:hypothetical protein [Sneathiella sp.]|jgi:hypothetical protein|uniref:hypothetical protein n=1 Tax=Sneathiella sp. TaxID=1964365 RepID=UPI0039E5C8BF